MFADIEGKPALQLAAMLRAGDIDAVELAEVTLDAVENCADKTVFIKITRERALAEARMAAKRIREGHALSVLDGVPLAWKDLFDMAGEATTAGSRLFAGNQPASCDAAIVARLQQAGMVSIGRVSMNEFAYSGLGLNPHYGTPLNPCSTDVPRIPGGSSSGSGVAVARGLVPVALGSDTGGSVRIPAACNGIIGYKASRGRYAMEGVFPLASSFDSLGPLCRTVTDALWIDALMCGRHAPDLVPLALKGLRVIIPRNIVFDAVDAGVSLCFSAALKRLEKAGVIFEYATIPAFDSMQELVQRHGSPVVAEAYTLHRQRVESADAAFMDPRVVTRIKLGSHISDADYHAVLEARANLIAEVCQQFGPEALFAFPTIPMVAPPIAVLETDMDAFFQANGRILRNTSIGNFLDWCGVSLPCGTAEAGMPAGFLISGLYGQDQRVLAAALAMERVFA